MTPTRAGDPVARRGAGLRLLAFAAGATLLAGSAIGFTVLAGNRSVAGEIDVGFLRPLSLMAESRAVLGEIDSYLLRSLVPADGRPDTPILDGHLSAAVDDLESLSADLRDSASSVPGVPDLSAYRATWQVYRAAVEGIARDVRADRFDAAADAYYAVAAPRYAQLDAHLAVAIDRVREGATARVGEVEADTALGQALLLGVAVVGLSVVTMTARSAIRHERRIGFQARLLDEVQSGIIVTDRADRITYWSRGAERIYGWSAAQALGRRVVDLIADQPDQSARVEAQVLRKGERWRGVLRDRRRDGERVYVEVESSPLQMGDDEVPTGAIAVAIDVTERELAVEKLRRLALYDSLTGLANRTLLQERLEQAIRASGSPSAPGVVALLYLDLHEFKATNDALGHAAGDDVLRAVAARLLESVRAHDTVARVGGDEFAIVLADVRSEGEARALAERIAASMASGVTVPIGTATHHLNSRVNIGGAVHPDHGTDAESLLRAADVAMYEAKRQGVPLVFYDRRRGEEARRRWMRAEEVGRAVRDGQLVVHYQPQVSLVDGQIVGLEALVRWDHPVDGLLSPAAFVPLAEETGAIDGLSRWVVRRAIQDVARLRAERPDLRVSVNLSPVNLRDRRFMRWLVDRMRALPDPSAICIEVTESIVIQATPDILRSLNRLRAIGVGISLDDFGTGYSSLSVLRDLPLTELKIDGSFVSGFRHGARDQRIVRTIIDLAGTLGLDTVAEAVDDVGVAVRLREMGCRVVQGYAFGRPLPLAELRLDAMPMRLPRVVHSA